MKKLLITASIIPNTDSVTIETLQQTLRQLGSVSASFCADVELAETQGFTQEICLYISSDDSEPYIKVPKPGLCEGQRLTNEQTDVIRQLGVCTELYAEYPRADKYGAPIYATEDDFAAGLVGNHGFRVSATNFSAHAEDRGDDGCDTIWLTLLLLNGSLL